MFMSKISTEPSLDQNDISLDKRITSELLITKVLFWSRGGAVSKISKNDSGFDAKRHRASLTTLQKRKKTLVQRNEFCL